MSDYVDATFYAQVEPIWSRWPQETDADGQRVKALSGAKVTRITQARPARPASGCVLVKLTLRVPKSVFLPLRPQAVVVLPENLAEVIPLVEAHDPREEQA